MDIKFSTCLIKRNHKVKIVIDMKKKLVRENIYSLITDKIVCQEEKRHPSLKEAVQSYYHKIDKFEHLGYEMPTAPREGKVIMLDKKMGSGIL